MSEQTNTPQPAEPIVAEKSLQVFHLERELSAAQKRVQELEGALWALLDAEEQYGDETNVAVNEAWLAAKVVLDAKRKEKS